MAMRICLLLLILASRVEYAISQEAPKVIENVLTSMKWADNLGSLELEVTTTKNSKSTLKSAPIASSSKTIEKFREFREGDDFCIASAFGVTLITTKNGHDSRDESISMSYRWGSTDFSNRVLILPSGELVRSTSNCGSLSASCLDVSRGFVLGRIILQYVMSIPQGEIDREADILLEKILAAKHWHVTEEISKQTKKCLVYRFSNRVNENTTFAYKIVVSDEGFDRGYVNEVTRFKLRKEEFENSFQNDDQVVSESSYSVVSNWGEFETTNGKKVLLVRLVQQYANGAISEGTKSWDFNWKNFGSPDASLMTDASCHKMCTDLARQIDSALGR